MTLVLIITWQHLQDLIYESHFLLIIGTTEFMSKSIAKNVAQSCHQDVQVSTTGQSVWYTVVTCHPKLQMEVDSSKNSDKIPTVLSPLQFSLRQFLTESKTIFRVLPLVYVIIIMHSKCQRRFMKAMRRQAKQYRRYFCARQSYETQLLKGCSLEKKWLGKQK